MKCCRTINDLLLIGCLSSHFGWKCYFVCWWYIQANYRRLLSSYEVPYNSGIMTTLLVQYASSFLLHSFPPSSHFIFLTVQSKCIAIIIGIVLSNNNITAEVSPPPFPEILFIYGRRLFFVFFFFVIKIY